MSEAIQVFGRRSTLGSLVSRAFPSPEWAVFFEVSDSTGFRASRRADAIALGIWPSRGHEIIGFEFKEDRRDWLRERKNPEKADTIAGHCDRWYVVAGAEKIVPIEELPEPWGLYVASADRARIKCVKPAIPFSDRNRSVMARSFAAAMLRKVTETTVPVADLERRLQEAAAAALAGTRDGREAEALRRRVEQLDELLEKFKTATGIDLRYDWRGPSKLGAAVNAVLSGEHHRRGLEQAADRLDAAARQIREAVAVWPAAAGLEVVPARENVAGDA